MKPLKDTVKILFDRQTDAYISMLIEGTELTSNDITSISAIMAQDPSDYGTGRARKDQLTQLVLDLLMSKSDLTQEPVLAPLLRLVLKQGKAVGDVKADTTALDNLFTG